MMCSAKKPVKFKTITLNESLSADHLRDTSPAQEISNLSKEEAREAKTQTKIEKRAYYKSIRSKPKGKKAGHGDASAAKMDATPWRQPEWKENEGEYDDY